MTAETREEEVAALGTLWLRPSSSIHLLHRVRWFIHSVHSSMAAYCA